jgi:hypothetical protein
MEDVMLRFKASLLFCDTLIRAVWRKRGRGVAGFCRYPFLLLKSFALTIIGICIYRERALIFMSAYAWFRRIDDIIDGDAPLPTGYASREAYIGQRGDALRSAVNGSESSKDFPREDITIFHLRNELVGKGIDALHDIEVLWSVLEWSFYYQAQGYPLCKEELKRTARLQDAAFFSFCGKVFGCDAGRLKYVCDRLDGILTRLGWLRDLDSDLRKGIAAISSDAFGLTTAAIIRQAKGKGFNEIACMPSVARWYENEKEVLFCEWKAVRSSLGNNFGGAFLSQSLAHFALRLIDRSIAKAFLDIAKQSPSCYAAQHPFA